MRFELLTPIKDPRVKDGLITHIEVRAVQTVADTLHANAAGKTALEQSLHLVARLCGLDFAKEVTQLDMRDVNKILDLIAEMSVDPRDPKPDPEASGVDARASSDS